MMISFGTKLLIKVDIVLKLLYTIFVFESAGIAQLVERQPSKLRVAGSNPVSRSNIKKEIVKPTAHVAQLVERFLGKEEVHRFNPGRGLHCKDDIFISSKQGVLS